MTFTRIGAALALISVAWRGSSAQDRIPSYAELRGDVIAGNGTAVEGGAGFVFPLGVYVRMGLDAAAGATWRSGSTRASGRVDAIARYLLDPFREIPVAVSLGGGVSVPYASGDKNVRPYLTAVIDVEGRRRGRLTPAIQLGIGGGARVGLVFRTSPQRWR